MKLLSALDKLIREHGSASILRDHLALFKDQVVKLESDNETLKNENISLNKKINDFEQNIRALRGKIKGYETQPNSSNDSLTNQEIEILKYIASGDHLVEDIMKKVQIGKEVINFHLAEIEQKNFISSSDVPMVGTWWELEQAGRKFLIENQHIT